MLFTGEEKHGHSANSVAEQSRFSLLSEKEADGGEETALIKGRRMWGVLGEPIKLPVSGPLRGGMAWLLPPAGLSSQCLHGSAAFTHNSRGQELGPEKAEPPSDVNCSQ